MIRALILAAVLAASTLLPVAPDADAAPRLDHLALRLRPATVADEPVVGGGSVVRAVALDRLVVPEGVADELWSLVRGLRVPVPTDGIVTRARLLERLVDGGIPRRCVTLIGSAWCEVEFSSADRPNADPPNNTRPNDDRPNVVLRKDPS